MANHVSTKAESRVESRSVQSYTTKGEARKKGSRADTIIYLKDSTKHGQPCVLERLLSFRRVYYEINRADDSRGSNPGVVTPAVEKWSNNQPPPDSALVEAVLVTTVCG